MINYIYHTNHLNSIVNLLSRFSAALTAFQDSTCTELCLGVCIHSSLSRLAAADYQTPEITHRT